MTIDIDDADLNDLMAELEDQNRQIEASQNATKAQAEPEPVVTVVAEPEPEFDEGDLDALADLDTMTPTATDKLGADQQVQLESAFEKPTEIVAEVEEPQTKKLEPVQEQVAEPIKEVQTEQLPDEKRDPEPERVPEPRRELKAEPRDETTPTLSDQSAKEASQLKYKPNLEVFQRETKITDATIDQCMYDQAPLMAYYTAQHAYAENQLAKVKQGFSTLEAGLYDAYRKHFIAAGEKVTEKAIENAVRMDKKWIKAHLLLIEAQTYADIHKGFVTSMHDRRGMLMQIGADRREEMKGQLRTSNHLSPSSPVQQEQRQESLTMSQRAQQAALAAMARS